MFKLLQKPKRLVSNTEAQTERFGSFTAQPFERGFGSTIGTSLRRVLLSSIEGAAITAVRIEGVEHEFSPIPGIVEDATDIILNLKQIPFKMSVDGVRTVRVNSNGAGEVLSGMIETDADVEVLDRNLHIATVSEGGKVSIEMRLKQGRGYVSADRNYDEDLPLGYIPIDSVHSPVRKVNYTVEAARLGQMTDYDKLTIEVWTNGAISPADAIGQASKLLKDHMSIFINFEELPEVTEEPAERAMNQMNEVLNRSVEELDLADSAVAVRCCGLDGDVRRVEEDAGISWRANGCERRFVGSDQGCGLQGDIPIAEIVHVRHPKSHDDRLSGRSGRIVEGINRAGSVAGVIKGGVLVGCGCEIAQERQQLAPGAVSANIQLERL